MSLINEALKKAQKQRTGEAPPLASMPAIGGESAARIARRAKPAPINTLLIRLGMGAGALVVVLIAAVWLLRRPSTPELPVPTPAAPVSTATPSPASTPTPAASAPVVVPPPAATASTDPVFTVPISAPPASAAPVATPARNPAPVAAAPVTAPSPAPAAAVPTPAPASAPARLEPRAITYIENIRVAGIRASASDSKVLMNDRVYRVGNTVEPELGLRLVEITASSLTFEDDRGARYTRHF